MRISDWSSDVCSSDLGTLSGTPTAGGTFAFTVEARGAYDQPGSRDYTLAIAAVVPVAAAHHAKTLSGGTVEVELTEGATGRPFHGDRKSVVEGKSVSVRVDLGGRRILKTKNKDKQN